MAIVRYCILDSSTNVCTDVINWDNTYTYYPGTGRIIAGDNTGEVGWSYSFGASAGGSWTIPPYGSAPTITYGPLEVADGGTGASTLTGIVKGNGTSAFTTAVAGTDYVSPSSYATGIATFLGAPSSANLLAAMTTETGTGTLVFNTSPSFSTSIGVTGGTITANTPAVDVTQTWNNSGVTFTGLRANVTDTASNASSLLMDLQVGSSSQFAVAKDGTIWFKGGGNNGTLFSSGSNLNFKSSTATIIAAGSDGVRRASISSNGVELVSGAGFTWSSNAAGPADTNKDLYITRRAAANLRFGAGDAAAPVAQTLSVQSVSSGTANTAGPDLTITGSQSTGSASGGSVIIQTAGSGSASTFTVTFTNGSSTIAGTGLPTTANTPVAFTTTGALPTNFAINTTYYVRSGSTSTAITVSATPGGAAISAGSAGSGTHTLTQAAAQNLLTERVRIGPNGEIGLGGANYGTSGQVLTSNGSGAAPTWQTASGGSSLPSGMLAPYAGSSAPSGWLLCDGSAVSRTTYSALFTAISTTYGVGDGSTTFNLPDLRGRAVRGLDNMGGTAANRITSGGSGITGTTLGASGGAETVTLTTAQMPAHTHTVTGWSGSAGSTNHIPEQVTNISGSAYATSSSGTGGAHNNTGPTIMLNYIIKT